MDDEAEILNERLRCSCASFSIGAIPFPIDPLCSLVGTFFGSGTMKQASPLVEDIDLVDEMITIRNPSKALRDISGYKISDDQGHNVFYFHEGTCIEPEGVLYLYCCAKNETSKHHVRTRLEPHVQWTNKGTRSIKTEIFHFAISTLLRYLTSRLISFFTNFARDKRWFQSYEKCT